MQFDEEAALRGLTAVSPVPVRWSLTASGTPAVTDLAEATATGLAQAAHEGESLEMTGPDAIGWEDLAKPAGVPFRPLPDGERHHARGLALELLVPDGDAAVM